MRITSIGKLFQAGNPLVDVAITQSLKVLNDLLKVKSDSRDKLFLRSIIHTLQSVFKQGDKDRLIDALLTAKACFESEQGDPKLGAEITQALHVVEFTLESMGEVTKRKDLPLHTKYAAASEKGEEVADHLGNTLEDLLELHKPNYPELTLEDLEKEMELGVPIELEEHGEGAKPEKIAADHLREYPLYYSKLLIPAEKKAGVE